MAVDDQIETPQLSHDRVRSKLLCNRIVVAKVGDENHIVRPGLTSFIDGLLQPDTQPLARLVGQKIVHRLAGLVQNVLDRGFCIGVRGNRSDEADFQVAGLQNAPGLKHRLPACDAEIRAGIAAVQSLGAVVERFKPVIELVVARHGQVIAKAVHHPDDLSALGDGPDGGPLYGVPGVDQQNVVIFFFEFFLVQGQAIVPDVILESHMRVVRVQDHCGDLLRVSGHGGVSEGERRKKAAERQQTCDDQRNDRFFHKRYSLSVYRVFICAI